MYIVGLEQDLNIRKEKILQGKEIKTFLTLTFGTRSLPFYCKRIVNNVNDIPNHYLSVEQTIDLNSDNYNEVLSRVTYQVILHLDNDNIYFDDNKNIYLGDNSIDEEYWYTKSLKQDAGNVFQDLSELSDIVLSSSLYKYSFYLDTFYLKTGRENNEMDKLLSRINGVSQIRLSFGKQATLSNNMNNKFILSEQYNDSFNIESANVDENGQLSEYLSMLMMELPYVKDLSIDRHKSTINFNIYLFEKILNFNQIMKNTLVE